jgi:hypothetical protein
VEIVIQSVRAPEYAGSKMQVVLQNAFESKACKTRSKFNTGSEVEFGTTIQVRRLAVFRAASGCCHSCYWHCLAS